jgi:hypothetical protein
LLERNWRRSRWQVHEDFTAFALVEFRRCVVATVLIWALLSILSHLRIWTRLRLVSQRGVCRRVIGYRAGWVLWGRSGGILLGFHRCHNCHWRWWQRNVHWVNVRYYDGDPFLVLRLALTLRVTVAIVAVELVASLIIDRYR